MNQQSNATPLQQTILMPNLPPPQVITATLGRDGLPLPPFVIDNDISVDQYLQTSKAHLLGYHILSTDMDDGEELAKGVLPAHVDDTSDTGPLITFKLKRVISPVDLFMRCHLHYESAIRMDFVFVGPPPLLGKLVFLYDPQILNNGGGGPQTNGFNDSKHRFYNMEWDLNKTKLFSVMIPLWKSANRRTTHYRPQLTYGGTARNYAYTGYRFADMFMGQFSLRILETLQSSTLFPTSYQIMSYISYENLTCSTPISPGRLTSLYAPVQAYHTSFVDKI